MPTTLSYKLDFKLILLGFFVGIFSAGIGIGGGTLMVSLLMSIFGFDFKKAATTSLATIIPISFIGAASHFIFLPVMPNLQYYLVFIPLCVMGTILGGKIVQKYKNRWLKFAFSLFLLIVSIRMLKLFDLPSFIYGGLHDILFANELLIIGLFGVIIGIVASLLGIGCGLLIVPFYVIIINFNMHEAITLSLSSMFFLTLSATIINKKLKTVDIIPLKSLLIPALIGAIIGAVISSRLPAPILKKIFGVFLFITACRYMLDEIKQILFYREQIK
jgi:uncharacterized protein